MRTLRTLAVPSFMPLGFYQGSVGFDYLHYLTEFVLTKAFVPSDPNGIQPDFRLTACLRYMHVNRFAQIVAVETKPKTSFTQHSRHSRRLGEGPILRKPLRRQVLPVAQRTKLMPVKAEAER